MANHINLDTIKQEIGKIKDNDLNLTLSELNAINKIEWLQERIYMEIELIQPIHWIAEKIHQSCVNVLKDFAHGYEYEIDIKETFEDFESRKTLKGVKNLIAISSGKGGVGKSSMTANLAAALSLKGTEVGLVDADIYGPSLPTMFGASDMEIQAFETEDGDVVANPIEKFGIKMASMGNIMNRDQAAIIRGPLLAKYFSLLYDKTLWGSLDFMLFDLPPGTGDIQLSMTQQIPLSGSVIVTTPQEISVADVRRNISMYNKVDVEIFGVVENMSYFVPPDMPDKKYYIFGQGGGEKVAKEFDVPFLGEVPLDIKMREGSDEGRPVVFDEDSNQSKVIQEIADRMVSALRKRNYENLTKQVDIEL